MPTGYYAPVPPQVSAKATVVAKAADATLTVADFGKQITNTGAAGTVVLTFPKAADAAGCSIRVQITVAQIVRVLPVTGESVYLGGSGVASKYLNIAGVIGNYCDIYSNGESYEVTAYSGVVTKEA
jgi:hypothetical protein